MKSFIDGNHICITRDNFVDLQSSPAVFYPLSSKVAETVLQDGITFLPISDLRDILMDLAVQDNVLRVHAKQNPERKNDGRLEER